MFKNMLLRLFLYFKGLRFYKIVSDERKTGEFRTATFELAGGHKVDFCFFKEICVDLVFKRGKISKHTFISYIVQARFDEAMPEALIKYNNLKFFFNGRYIYIDDETLICKAMLGIYLDLIHDELKSL